MAFWALLYTCYLKLLKDCADVSLNKRPCTHQSDTTCCDYFSSMGSLLLCTEHSRARRFISGECTTFLCRSVTATCPDWAPPTGTWLLTTQSPTAKFRCTKEQQTSLHMCLLHPYSYLPPSNQKLISLSLSLSRIISLPTEQLYKQIPVCQQLHYSCDIWPIRDNRTRVLI